jgi:hypothetical protein
MTKINERNELTGLTSATAFQLPLTRLWAGYGGSSTHLLHHWLSDGFNSSRIFFGGPCLKQPRK